MFSISFRFLRQSGASAAGVAALLAAGTLGGAVGGAVGLPLPWMLGAMVGAFVFAWTRPEPPRLPRPMRVGALVALGLYMGGAIVAGGKGIPPGALYSIAALLLISTLMTILAAAFFIKFLKHDFFTAYCAALPGGLSPVIALAVEYRAQTGVVALVQTIRVVATVFTVPLAALALSGAEGGGFVFEMPGAGAPLSFTGALTAAAVVGAALVCSFVLPRAAGSMLPTLFLSAAAHWLGWIDGALPAAPLSAAQVFLGSFAGAALPALRGQGAMRTTLAAVAAAAAMIVLSAAAAWPVAQMIDSPFFLVWLAFAPGGIAEMGLAAMAMGMEPQWILVHHLARIVALLGLSPLVLRLASRRIKKTNK